MIVNLKNNMGGFIQAKVGVSWTYFFFGSFVPLFRGDFKWFILTMIFAICTFGLSHLYFMFAYNKIYIKEKIQQWYKPEGEIARGFCKAKGIYYG